MKDTIKIIISQLAVFISKQNVFIFSSKWVTKHSSDDINILFKKSELYLLVIFKNEYKDHMVKDIKTNPKMAKITFIITYLIVSKIIISSLNIYTL